MRRVRDLVMEALEGPPKSDALAKYNQGDKSLKDILGVLDKVYGGQTSYIALQSELCNMQQAYGGSAKAFYQRMTPIIVQIQEKHAGHLKEEELANTTKDAFYDGLREEYKPLIAHKVDRPDRETGHHWRECPRPLRQDLQKAKDHDGTDEQRLNASGDRGAKGAHSPLKAAQNQKPTLAQGQS